jgi:lysophospholipase L1-like esterase
MFGPGFGIGSGRISLARPPAGGGTPTPTPGVSVPASGTPNERLAISGGSSGGTLSLSSPPTGVRIDPVLRNLIIDTAGSYPSISIVDTPPSGPPVTTVVSTTIATPSYIALGTVTKIMAFGDSITAGQNATSAPDRWVNKIAAAMSATLENYGAGGTVLSNAPTLGNASQFKNMTDRITGIGTADGTTAIVFAYGYNDARYTATPSTFNVTEFKASYWQDIAYALSRGFDVTKIHIAAPPYINDTGLTIGGEFAGQTRDGFEAFVQAACEVAAEFGVRLTNLYSFLRDGGFGAMTATGDNIHPPNAGHQLIFETIRDKSYVPNILTRPATVTSTPTGLTVAWSCAAVSGAVSYEYAVIDGGRMVQSQSAAGTSGSLAVPRGGLYNGMARAVFADGRKGPWRVNPTKFTVRPATGIFWQHDLSAVPAGTSLARTTPQIGGFYEAVNGSENFLTVASGGGIYSKDGGATTRNTATPANANYYVKGRYRFLTQINGQETALVGRMPDDGSVAHHWLRYVSSTGVFQLFFGGTQIGSNYSYPFPASGTEIDVVLNMNDTSISATINGVVNAISGTNSGQANAGHAGFRMTGGASSPTTGIHIKLVEAGTL